MGYLNRMTRFLTLLIMTMVSCLFRTVTVAQSLDPFRIRVAVNTVVLPVTVIDKSQVNGGYECDKEITNLTSKKFHVFEDGIEQTIQSISFGPLNLAAGVKDNMGFHREISTSSSGIWIWPESETPTGPNDDTLRVYTVSYAPPPSSKGSCHQIKVKVDHRHATLDYRDQYCNMESTGSDPMNGTRLGKQMERFASTAKGGELPLRAQVSSLFGNSNLNRIQIALDLPSKKVKREWSDSSMQVTIAVLGIIYDKNKTVVARFSDDSSNNLGTYCGKIPVPLDFRKIVESLYIPIRYETQIELSPGDYDLNVVLSDGENFGQVEMPLKIGGYKANALAISDIVLCKGYHPPLVRPSGYVPLVSKNLEYSATGDAYFSKYEPVLAYFQVRDPLLEKSGNTSVQFELRVIDEKTGEVKIDSGLKPADSWIQPGNTIMSIAEGVVIDKLDVGTYRLEVQASDSTENKTEWHFVSFKVQ